VQDHVNFPQDHHATVVASCQSEWTYLYFSVAAEASSSRDVDAAHPTVFAQDSLSDVVSGVGATTCIHSVQSSGGHAANDDPRNVSTGLDAHGPQDCAAKSKSMGGLRAEYRVDKTVVATLSQLSAHVAP